MSESKKPAKKKKSAGGRIKAQGKTLVWATFTAAEKQLLRTAAAFEGLPMSEFIKRNGLTAAEKILKKIRSRDPN